MITGYEHVIQLSVLVKAVGFGYFSCLLFLVFTAINRIFLNKAFFIFIKDAFYPVVITFFGFMFLLKYNAGIVRFYIIAGEVMGFCLCYISSEKMVCYIVDSLIKVLKRFSSVVKEKTTAIRKKSGDKVLSLLKRINAKNYIKKCHSAHERRRSDIGKNKKRNYKK